MSDFRALDAMIRDYPPMLRCRTPYWRPEAPTVARECRIPAWNWERSGMEDVTDRVILDANGAFMAPLSGTELAHRELVRTGTEAGTYKPSPGYYRIEAHTWEDRRLCSPLGTAPIPPTARRRTPLVWVAAPTIDLLHKLSLTGHWPEITVHDSWTGRDDDRCRLKDWAAYISQERADALHRGDRIRYQAIKDGYSIAIQMMLGPAEGKAAKAEIRRPDWYHAIRASTPPTCGAKPGRASRTTASRSWPWATWTRSR
jgi:hypothetical protein